MIAYKTEINPTEIQQIEINKTLGVCRYVYNMYLIKNKEYYSSNNTFLSGYEFSKWLNNIHIKENQQDIWIKEVFSKSVKQAIMNGDKAYRNFFKGLSKHPRFKKKKDNNISAYYPKNNPTDLQVERHRIKIPKLGWVRLKEYGYIPTNEKVKSCTISFKAGRYYISVLVDKKKENINDLTTFSEGIGIDLGIKDLAIVSNNMKYGNMNKTAKIRKIEKRLKQNKKKLSRSYETNKNRNRGENCYYKNRRKTILNIQKLNARLSNIRSEYRKKVINEIVKTKPSYITIENLNIKGMLKNKHLAKSISNQGFYYFIQYLKNKCVEYGIELRQVSRFYPSSKLCSCCGYKKDKLSLSERLYRCENCGEELDRDYNASVNLKQANDYTILT